MISLIFAAPWLILLAYLVLRLRLPEELAPEGDHAEDAPLVSVIIPARNEEDNILVSAESVGASTYPNFELIVVDDRSTDRTAQVARAAEIGNAARYEVLSGAELPEDWLGKPWACAQGAREARGDILLFTDADTTHHPELLSRAVADLRSDGADALTLLGKQIMLTFWEKIVQPHIFFSLTLGFPDFRTSLPAKRWRRALANGQYLLIPRAVYEEVGGHVAVKGEVVEDQRLAQILCKAGKRLDIRLAENHFATRMYSSLPGMIEGWSKNVALASRQSFESWFAPMALPSLIATVVLLWIVPPVVVVLDLAGVGVGFPAGVAQTVTVGSALFWCACVWRFGAPPWFGLLYPLGAAVEAYIFTRSLVRGRRVEWKGRTYVVPK
ncbi:MAG: hydroxychlorobactene glucosyltransferase CruC [Gemmatimonadota bacterium]|nr:MAG: hydroxychlorobactene glucosyltransferase CruC [Gemmatimonadota bacterium]